MKFLPVLLIVVLAFTGCNAAQIATDTSNALGAILAIAQAETPAIPAQDQALYSSFVSLAQSLQTQLNTCISASGTKASKFLTCFNSFATGLNSPTELAQLRLLSPKTQQRVQLYDTAAIVAINVALKYFGGTPTTSPTVAAEQPTQQELRQLSAQLNLAY